MWIIKRNDKQLPYYAGTNPRGVISWSSRKEDAVSLQLASAAYRAMVLRNQTGDTTIKFYMKD